MSIIILLTAIFLPLHAAAETMGYGDQLISYIYSQQQLFHRELAGAIRAIKSDGLVAAWGLVTTSFFYGIFHAAGPGHGKAIISTYVVTHESKLKRAITLSFASAFMQGVSAVTIVSVATGLIGMSNRDTHTVTNYLEQFSFALVALIGLILIYRVLKVMRKKRAGHHHHHAEGCSGCGHSHAPPPQLLDSQMRWQDTLAIILSVGIRPCSGSVLILIFANVIDLHWVGIGAVFAISLGTAITVSALAFLAVHFRKAALRISQKTYGKQAENIFLLISLLGGLTITGLGASLFFQAATTQHPLF